MASLNNDLRIVKDDLNSDEIAAFLQEHLDEMHRFTPADGVHALNLESLKQPGIDFWSVWSGDEIVGCGALRELSSLSGEIKSMRTGSRFRGQGVASTLLSHLITVARDRGYEELLLETGSLPPFKPAQKLYRKFGFVECGPFENYEQKPSSCFMKLNL